MLVSDGLFPDCYSESVNGVRRRKPLKMDANGDSSDNLTNFLESLGLQSYHEAIKNELKVSGSRCLCVLAVLVGCVS